MHSLCTEADLQTDVLHLVSSSAEGTHIPGTLASGLPQQPSYGTSLRLRHFYYAVIGMEMIECRVKMDTISYVMLKVLRSN